MSVSNVNDDDSRIRYSPGILDTSEGLPCKTPPGPDSSVAPPIPTPPADGSEPCANMWLTQVNLDVLQTRYTIAIPATAHGAFVPSTATAQFNFTGSGVRIFGGAVNFSEAPDGISGATGSYSTVTIDGLRQQAYWPPAQSSEPLQVFTNESLGSATSQHTLSLDFTNSQYGVIYIDYLPLLECYSTSALGLALTAFDAHGQYLVGLDTLQYTVYGRMRYGSIRDTDRR
ncbi:hypothetical protein EXIGLDRAFT_715782 [Exidia glandulosa HHB12029]|uniref:Uncharacterized protein n=1 Tax=Exidia glandulosa HHB12029 TaxID=1314781 RepID=A0A165QJN0_EXIGL|nr:hypothetical protein EXIGLDRAFT_715782 [Exidia glandulosa HHB12029]